MLIPDRKGALIRARDAAMRMVTDAADEEQVKYLAACIANALGHVLQLEDRGKYAQLYRQGWTLAQAGLPRADSAAIGRLFASLPVEHGALANTEDIRPSMAVLLQCLTEIVKRIARRTDSSTFHYLNQVTDWEIDLYRQLDPPPATLKMPTGAAFTQPALQNYLRGRLPDCRNLVVTQMKVLYGGYSKLTILFSIRDDRFGDQSMVIRAEKHPHLVYLEGAEVAKEFAAVRYLFNRGRLPIAEPLWVETDETLFGTRFMVSRRATGTVFGTSLSDINQVPDSVRSHLLSTLADIHRQPLDVDDPLLADSHLLRWTRYASLQANTAAWVEYWKAELDRSGTPSTPLTERACAWLVDNAPREEIKPALVHGDYGFANLLFNDNQISAVLDWELSFYGDPGYDFVNFMHQYDRSLLDAYERAGGQHISEYRFFYWTVVKAIKGVTILIGLNQFDTEPDAPINVYNIPRYQHLLTAPLNQLLEKAQSLPNPD